MTMTIARIAAVVAVAGALSGCASGSTEPSAGQAPSATVTRAPLDPAKRQAINDCLRAAGLPTPTPAMRTVEPGADAPPAGGPGGRFADPKVRAALEACGIEVPAPAQGVTTTGSAG